jgi:acyl carrier protein
MNEIKEKINNVIKTIQLQNDFKQKELLEDAEIMRDLGFASLDVAQLIAMLEIELGVEPFSAGVSITDIRTVGELHATYQKSLAAA